MHEQAVAQGNQLLWELRSLGGDTHGALGTVEAHQPPPPSSSPLLPALGTVRAAAGGWGGGGGCIPSHGKPSGAAMSEAQLIASNASSNSGRGDWGEDGSSLQPPLPAMLLGGAGARKRTDVFFPGDKG